MIAILLCLLCCNDTVNNVINGDNGRMNYSKYSNEAFNYFYEVCFFDEIKRKNVHLSKWRNDVKYYISGNPSKGDIEIVIGVIDKLNYLKLPIRFHLVENKDSSNVSIHFGDATDLKLLGFIEGAQGTSSRSSSYGVIDAGKILILNNGADVDKRESVILEEMVQIVGSISDSFSHPQSIFYEGHKVSNELLPIDIEVIRLLYDSLIPTDYTIEDYERDFSAVVNYYKTSEKLKRIFVREGVAKSTLEEIKKTCYLDGVFYKHPKEIPVYLNGFTRSDSSFVLKSLKFFNELSHNIKLVFDSKPDGLTNTGISIKLIVNDSQEYPTETNIWNTKGEVFKPKRIKSKAEISFQSSIELKKRRSVILKAIYKSLGPTEMHFEDDWFTYDGEKVVINKKYADIIRIIYSDEFVDGYPLKEFEELIKSF